MDGYWQWFCFVSYLITYRPLPTSTPEIVLRINGDHSTGQVVIGKRSNQGPGVAEKQQKKIGFDGCQFLEPL